MELSAILTRIEARLKALRLSADAASKLAGKNDAIRNLRRAVRTGERDGITTTTIDALSPILKTTSEWLLHGTGDIERSTVALVGMVGADTEASFFEEGQGPFDMVEAPPWANDSTVAVEIRGESLGSSFNGWLIFYDDRREPVTDDLIGRLCVVGLTDGRVLVKTISRGQRPHHFNLSANVGPPIYDAEISWAALVKEMRPR